MKFSSTIAAIIILILIALTALKMPRNDYGE
jgi:hypothetical protein